MTARRSIESQFHMEVKMNTRSMICLLGLGVAMPAVGLAQSESTVGVYGSWWDTDEADDAFGIGAKGRLGMFELRGTYYEDLTSNSIVEVEAMPIDAGVAFNFAPDMAINPFVGAGVSYFLLDTNVGDIDDEVGWYAVVGGELGMAEGISLMAELMYRDVEGTVEDGGVTSQPDIDLSGITANVGAAWRF